MRGTAWAFAVCFAAITVVSWRYLIYPPYRFLNGEYSVFDCGRMAFSEAHLKPLVCVCSSLPVNPRSFPALPAPLLADGR
jgi:hypothetical protein